MTPYHINISKVHMLLIFVAATYYEIVLQQKFPDLLYI